MPPHFPTLTKCRLLGTTAYLKDHKVPFFKYQTYFETSILEKPEGGQSFTTASSEGTLLLRQGVGSLLYFQPTYEEWKKSFRNTVLEPDSSAGKTLHTKPVLKLALKPSKKQWAPFTTDNVLPVRKAGFPLLTLKEGYKILSTHYLSTHTQRIGVILDGQTNAISLSVTKARFESSGSQAKGFALTVSITKSQTINQFRLYDITSRLLLDITLSLNCIFTRSLKTQTAR